MILMIWIFAAIDLTGNWRSLFNPFVMCVDGRWITNKYTGNTFFVKCGHCKSCLQEKAVKSTNRIRREFDGKRIALFVTLTYDRISCPYVLESDLLQHKMELPVYRDYRVYRNARTGKNKRVYGVTKLDTVVIPEEDYVVGRYKWLKHCPHKVGVVWFRDFQNFLKRLRINCSRSYICHEGFSIFDCSEYGPRTLRPHFHFLLFIRPQDEAFYRSAILQAWPFAHKSRTANYIELARDPASYVASYVNCRKVISPFFAKYFKPKHSFSQYFGTSDPQFSLSSLLSKVDQGNLTYVVRRNKQGVSEDVNFLIPQYVINRYFPIFKGYSRLACDEVSHSLLTTGECLRFFDYERSTRLKRMTPDGRVVRSNKVTKIDYSDEDIRCISTRLRNAYNYYHAVTGKNLIDYAIDFERIRRCYRSNVLKMSYENDNKAIYEHFDNVLDIVNGFVDNDFLREYVSENIVPLSPNDFPCNKDSTVNMNAWFDLYDKERKVINEIMSIYSCGSMPHYV